MKTIVLMMSLALISVGANAQHMHGSHGSMSGHESMSDKKPMAPMFEDETLGSAYSHYIHLKNALVKSNYDDAKSAADELATAVGQVKDGDKAKNEATKVAQSESLEDQRKVFAALSNAMAGLIRNASFKMGELYLDYCPMFNDKKGAYWLSNEKEILNPYYGDEMPKCGSVKETFK